MSKIILSFLLGLNILFYWGCSDKDDPVTPEQIDYSQIITDYADEVVVATYHELEEKAGNLKTTIDLFVQSSTQTDLDAACNAWKAARAPWENSEAFLFGPVAFLSLDPSMDSWPLDQAQLQQVLNSQFDLTPEFIRDGLGYSLRGFHTIEYLLFKDGSPRNVADVTQREKEYLSSVAQVLFEDTQILHNEWENGFRDEFVNAGKSGSRYSSQVQAIQEIIEGIITIADEVGNGKIGGPYLTKDVQSVESQFSWNSLTDFKNNIKSIENSYLGKNPNGTDGYGLDDFVRGINPTLDAKVKQEITATYNAIEAIPEPFRNNLNADVQITAAINACNTLVSTFQEDIKPLITN
jgi:putative iron-regulated protein